MSINSLLSSIHVFGLLSPATLDAVAQASRKRDYAAGEIVQLEGDPTEYVGFVLTGAVRIYRANAEGREQVLSTAGPGMHFNTVPALDPAGPGPLRASVRAVNAASVLLIPVGAYIDLVKTHADLAFAILVDFAGRLDHLTGLASDLALKSVRARLARFLLERAGAGGDVTESWTQDEVAAALGTVRDVVGRTLRGFLDAGLLRRDGGRLVIVDRERLAEVAEE